MTSLQIRSGRAQDARAMLLRAIPALALAALATTAHADQDVTSSDGAWKLHAKVVDSIGVKKTGEAVIDITPAAGAKGCPTVSSVVFEMPAHGHGGDKDPQSMKMGTCSVHVSDLVPSMSGDWRLRLVLKSGEKTSTADFAIAAK
jgi:hypothetical protein